MSAPEAFITVTLANMTLEEARAVRDQLAKDKNPVTDRAFHTLADALSEVEE